MNRRQDPESLSENLRQQLKHAAESNDPEYLSLQSIHIEDPPDPDTDKEFFSDYRKNYEDHLLNICDQTDTGCDFHDVEELTEALDVLNRAVSELTVSRSGQSESFLKKVMRKLINYGIGSDLQGINKSLSELTRVSNIINHKLRRFVANQNQFNTETAVFGQGIVPVIDEKIRYQIKKHGQYLKDRMDMFHESTDRRQTEISNWLHNATRAFESLGSRVDELEKYLNRTLASQHRKLEQALTVTDSRVTSHSANPAIDSTNGEMSSAETGGDFGYYLFETMGRGSEQFVENLQSEYVRFFNNAPGPVLDVGCGRGEFLSLLKQNKIAAEGIDSNMDMIEACRQKNLDVRHGDALKVMSTYEKESIGGIFAGQMVEHLSPKDLNRWLLLANDLLRPGGVIVFETVNTASVFALLTHFYRDPTHKQPVHPDTYRFLTEIAGFKDVTITYRSPVSKSELPDIPVLPDELGKGHTDDTLRKLRNALRQLTDFVYAPCDILVAGRKPEVSE